MADNKNTIVVYKDWIDIFEGLEDDEAGRLVKHLFRYINDKNPEYPDRITQVAFTTIMATLKRDLKKWNVKAGVLSETGRIGGLKSAEVKKQAKSTKINQMVEPEEIAKQNKAFASNLNKNEKNLSNVKQNQHVSDSVSVTVSDNVSDTVTNIDDKKINIPKNKFSVLLFNQIKNQFCSFYLENKKESYYWSAKDGGKVHPICHKLVFKIKEKKPEKVDVSDSEIADAFKYFLTKIPPGFMTDNLSMSLIESKFNEIISSNGTETSSSKSGSNNSLQHLAELSNAILQQPAS